MNARRSRRESARGKPARASGGPGTRTNTESDVRIIGGSLRGQKLLRPERAGTRPMKDRVREAIFNLIGKRVEGAVAIDLFAGTGALGLEALSRGAAEAVMIEQHFPTARVIQENVRRLDLEPKSRVVTGDAFYWALQPLAPGRRLVVFCSPPYALYQTRPLDIRKLLLDVSAHAAEESVLVAEFDDRFTTEQLPFPEAWETRVYFPARVAICETPFPIAPCNFD